MLALAEISHATAQRSEPAHHVSAEERAVWLIEYFTSHQGQERSELLRKTVAQITAAEAEAYEKGWAEAVLSAGVKRQD